MQKAGQKDVVYLYKVPDNVESVQNNQGCS